MMISTLANVLLGYLTIAIMARTYPDISNNPGKTSVKIAMTSTNRSKN